MDTALSIYCKPPFRSPFMKIKLSVRDAVECSRKGVSCGWARMSEGDIRDGSRRFAVNQRASIYPQEPASVNRLRQFNSESFPLRKWQILAFLAASPAGGLIPQPRAAGKSAEQLSQQGNSHPPAVNTPSFLHFAPRREGPGMQIASAPGFGTSAPSPGPRVIFCPVGMNPPLKLLLLPGGGVRKSLMDRRSFGGWLCPN